MTNDKKKRVWDGGVVNVRLPQDEWDYINELATKDMRSTAMVMRLILREHRERVAN